MIIREMPEAERPREKLMQHGSASLANRELIATLKLTSCIFSHSLNKASISELKLPLPLATTIPNSARIPLILLLSSTLCETAAFLKVCSKATVCSSTVLILTNLKKSG